MYYSMRAISFLLLLLLGMSSSVDIELCPAESDIRPCECSENDDAETLEVECNEEQTLEHLKEALGGFAGKKNINLGISSTTLGVVPSDFFNGIEINRLEFNGCELDSLTDDDDHPMLLGLEFSLLELVIASSFKEKNVPAKLQLGHLHKLKEIDLSYNVITEIGDEWFDKGPSSLEYLTISNNDIEKIGSRAFANLINLKQLSLDGNRFGPIRRSMFPSPAESLEVLDLDNNALTSLPQDIFSDMPSLIVVSMRTNGILRFDEHTWYPIWNQIQSISVEDNPIECDSGMKWILSSKITPAIYGQCNSPREVEGMDISDYIEERS